MSAHIELNGVSAGYDGNPVIRDITFEVPYGDFLAILGPNASGKTTLLRTMARLLPPLAGSIHLGGRNLSRLSSRKIARIVALVPQEDHIGFDFTGLEIVAMGRYPYMQRLSPPGPDDWQRIEQAMRRTNTQNLRNRSVNAISGGERKRILLSRALAQEPEVLLLDEPTSNLDINYQKEILSLLRRLNDEHQLTVVLVIHDINLAALAAKRVLLLSGEGRLHSLGETETVLTEGALESVYGTEVHVETSPQTHRPHVTFELDE